MTCRLIIGVIQGMIRRSFGICCGMVRVYVGVGRLSFSFFFSELCQWVFRAYDFVLVAVVEFGEFYCFRSSCDVYSDIVGCIR
jgi:hypothetical protein